MALFYREPSQDSSKRRIISFVAAFVVVLMLFYRMQQAANQSETADGAKAEAKPVVQRMRFADGDPLMNFTPSESMQSVSEATMTFLAADDKNVGEDADPVAITPAACEVLEWSMNRDAQGKALASYSRNHWNWEKLMSEPDQWRLAPVHLYGRLMKVQEIDCTGQREGLRKLFRLTLLDEYTQDYYTVLTPAIAADAKPFASGVYNGDTVACDAIFLKRFAYVTNNGWKRVPLLVTRSVWRATEPPAAAPLLDVRGDPGEPYQLIQPKTTVAALDMDYLRDKVLAPNKDGTLPGSSSVRTFGVDIREMAAELSDEKFCLDHMFSYAYGFDEQKLHDEAQNPEISYATLMAGNGAPAWMMGKATRVSGVAGSVRTLYFPNDPNGITRVHLITIGDSSYTNYREFTWMVAVLNLPEGLRAGQTVDAEGIFYKLYPYRIQGGWHWSPLLVCKSVTARPTVASPFLPQSWTPTQRYFLYGVMIALGVFALGWMYRTILTDHNQMEGLLGRHRKVALRPQHGASLARKKKAHGARPDAAAPEDVQTPEDRSTGEQADSECDGDHADADLSQAGSASENARS